MEHIIEKVRRFVLDSFLYGDVGRMVKDQESLLQHGVMDSTGVLELIEFIEAEFRVTIEDSETVPQNLDSIAGIARFVSGKTSAAA